MAAVLPNSRQRFTSGQPGCHKRIRLCVLMHIPTREVILIGAPVYSGSKAAAIIRAVSSREVGRDVSRFGSGLP
jgi:hypothetical protein